MCLMDAEFLPILVYTHIKETWLSDKIAFSESFLRLLTLLFRELVYSCCRDSFDMFSVGYQPTRTNIKFFMNMSKKTEGFWFDDVCYCDLIDCSFVKQLLYWAKFYWFIHSCFEIQFTFWIDKETVLSRSDRSLLKEIQLKYFRFWDWDRRFPRRSSSSLQTSTPHQTQSDNVALATWIITLATQQWRVTMAAVIFSVATGAWKH